MNKTSDLESILLDYDPDCVILTETWLHVEIPDESVIPPSYVMVRRDRDRVGGGVAIVLKRHMSFSRMPDIPQTESVWVKINFINHSLVIGALYRPPTSPLQCFESVNDYLCSHVGKNGYLVIGGDFNLPSINWSASLPYSSTPSFEPFIDMVFAHGLTQVVKEPTRITPTSSSILDLVLVNENVSKCDMQVTIEDGMSDHKMVFFSFSEAPPPLTSSPQFVRDFLRSDDAGILDALSFFFDDFIQLHSSTSSTVDDLWLYFKSLLLKCISDFVPLRKKMPRRNNPWITRDILHTKRKISRTRKRLNMAPNCDRTPLALLSTQLKEKVKQAKQFFYNNTLSNFLKSAPFKFWRYMSPHRDSGPCCIKGPDGIIQERQEMANQFNFFFLSNFSTDNQSLPRVDLTCGLPPLDDLCITEAGILNLLLKLDPKQSVGLDGIPNQMLIKYAVWCAKYIHLLFEKSLETRKIPSEWKRAKVIPIFKSGDKQLTSNYRPISLLGSVGKILEHIISKHITSFIESHNWFNPAQHGFRGGLSTVTQLVEAVHDFSSIINHSGQVDVIFLDFAKAFDRVPHSKLILKLRKLLQNDSIVDWFQDYLSQRTQVVSLNDTHSGSVPVLSGVPQGSVLGPLLFLIFINDISSDISVKIKLFADDCILYQEIKTPDDHHLLNISLEKVHCWCQEWQMSLNLLKTVSMTITRKKSPSNFNYSIDSHILQSVSQYKYLGIIISSDLRWNLHIDFIAHKAMKKLWSLRHSLRQATSDIKLTAYKTYVRSLLEYADVVWDPHTASNINKLEKIQKMALRFVFNSYNRNVSSYALRARAQLETLESRRRTNRLKFLFLVCNNFLKIAPENYITFFNPRSTRHRNCRSIKDYMCRNDCFKFSFFPRTIREWNELPAEATSSSSVDSFLRFL